MNANVNRRTEARHHLRLKVPCSLKRITQEAEFPALLASVSEEGLRLVVGQAFTPGMFLTVDLPTSGAQPKAWLLSVTTVKERSGSKGWYVDGVFVKKLTKEAVVAVQQRLFPPTTRQTRLRRPARLEVRCHQVKVRQEGPRLVDACDVSRRGIGLIADQPIPPGSFLTVELPGIRRKHLRPKLVRVTNARRQADQDSWFIGGVFLRDLSDDELQVLL